MNSVLRRFPVQIAVGAFLVYLLTISHGVTIQSIARVADICWNDRQLVTKPVFWLVTLPLHMLPASWVPWLLNLFSAICAAITLGLLARVTELLPFILPKNQLSVWQQRLTILLAVVVCGLEFNFWQSATIATGEMLDVLLFAIPVWCLLEFRANKEESWMSAAMFFWGLGMAENWMMLLALPLFLLLAVLLRPMDFVQKKFLLRMGLLGAAGFSVYALLPVANGLLPGAPLGFGEACVTALKQTGRFLLGIFFQFVRSHRLIGMVMLVFYLLPVMACLVRLHDEDSSNKSPLDQIQIWLFRGLRLILLGMCLWLALDPVAGPRGILKAQLGQNLSLLSFDFLNGMGAGILAGNLLLIGARKPRTARYYPGQIPVFIWLERAALPVVMGLTLFTTVFLLARNLGPITACNRQPLVQFGEMAISSLPSGGGVLLSDSPEKLLVFKAAQARHSAAKEWLTVDVNLLPKPEYRGQLERQRPGLWLNSTNSHELTPEETVQLVGGLMRSSHVYFLNSSSGFLFEQYFLESTGSVYELKRFQASSINPPALPPEQIAGNEKFWNGYRPNIESLLDSSRRKKTPVEKYLDKKLHLGAPPFVQGVLLREWYSMGLNSWGVDLQRSGHLSEAEKRFVQAMELSTNNWIAGVNLFCNTNLQAGNKMSLANVGALASQVGSMKNFAFFLNHYGPVDEAAFCFLLGNAYAQAALPRLAMQQFERAAALSPGVLAPEFALASLYIKCRLPQQADDTIKRIREDIKKYPGTNHLDAEVAFLEVDMSLMRNDLAGARRTLNQLAGDNADNPNLVERAVQRLLELKDFTDAGVIVAGQLARNPENISMLYTKSAILIYTSRAGEALPILDHILEITNNSQAKLIRAIANMQLTNYAAAKQDYLDLQATQINPFAINMGLGEIALGEGNTNQAVAYFQSCLSNAPPESPQWRSVKARLDALQNPAK